MNDENNFFHIEPLSTEDKTVITSPHLVQCTSVIDFIPQMEQLHAFYLDSEYKDKQGNCGELNKL